MLKNRDFLTILEQFQKKMSFQKKIAIFSYFPNFSTFWKKNFLKSNIRPQKIFLKSNNLCTKKSFLKRDSFLNQAALIKNHIFKSPS